MRLLDLNYQGRENFIKFIEQTKKKTRTDNKIHSFSTVINNMSFGLSFISMAANGDLEKIFKQTSSFTIMKKHSEKCNEWVGFGWDSSSIRNIDVAFFISYEWVNDPVIDNIARKSLKTGDKIDTTKQS